MIEYSISGVVVQIRHVPGARVDPADPKFRLTIDRYGCVIAGPDEDDRELLRDLGVIERCQVDHGPSFEDFLTLWWRQQLAPALAPLARERQSVDEPLEDQRRALL